jgi:predicted lipoprotein with Yx(FWY)xxD motif
LAASLVALPAATSGASTRSQTVVTTAKTKAWGPILVTSTGYTLYRFASDPKNKSVCSGSCAAVWPPVLLAAGQKGAVGKHLNGLGTIKRADGSRQVTYEGDPLYLYVGDSKPGTITGNITDTFGTWWVIQPGHPRSKPVAAKSSSKGSSGTPAGGGITY